MLYHTLVLCPLPKPNISLCNHRYASILPIKLSASNGHQLDLHIPKFIPVALPGLNDHQELKISSKLESKYFVGGGGALICLQTPGLPQVIQVYSVGIQAMSQVHLCP